MSITTSVANSNNSSNINKNKHTMKHKDDDQQPRQKRFKVGKACFTCRVKKIKVRLECTDFICDRLLTSISNYVVRWTPTMYAGKELENHR